MASTIFTTPDFGRGGGNDRTSPGSMPLLGIAPTFCGSTPSAADGFISSRLGEFHPDPVGDAHGNPGGLLDRGRGWVWEYCRERDGGSCGRGGGGWRGKCIGFSVAEFSGREGAQRERASRRR